MESRIKKLTEDASRLWSQRKSLENLWQEIAYHFYVEMADFTINRYLGQDWADHLTTSYPLLARRDLGNAISAMLRPVNLDSASPGVWFSVTTQDERLNEDDDARRWLEFATGVQRRAMYDRSTQFVRATKEADHSFVTFGQAPMSIQLNRKRDALLYQTHHLRDVVWMENAEGEIDTIFRRWKPTYQQLAWTFGSKASQQCKDRLSTEPNTEANCLHIMIDAEKYEQRDAAGKRFRTPWVSIWIDTENDHVMEEVGSVDRRYMIPRWVTIPGSQYASSPAVTAALPDARLIQAMVLTLLESGEKFADPPIIATQEAIRSDIQLFAGGMTFIDAEYDERLGDALKPLYESRAGEGMRVGFEMAGQVRQEIAKAFYLDSLSLPPMDVRQMTAFEVGQRISEWIRRAMPIFEPLEFEYNGPLCEQTFELLLRNGAFGPLDDMPDQLRGQEIKFKFESPLHESNERQKAQRFLEAKNALIQAAEIDPSVANTLDATETLRDVLKSIGVPADWTRSREDVEEMQAQQQADQQMAQGLEGAGAGADMAQKLGSAAKSFAEAGGAATPGPV